MQPCSLPPWRTLYEFSLSCPRTSGAGSANCFYDYDFTSDLLCMLVAHLPGPADVAGLDGENEFTASGCDFLFKCRSHFLTH